MDIDAIELAKTDEQDDLLGPRRSRLNPVVGVSVALLATFMGICKVKDDNIVQGMQQAQADKIDHWSFYQARNLREDMAKAALVQLTLQAADQPAPRQAAYQQAIRQAQQTVQEQTHKKEELRAQAVQDQATYDALNFRDDQFDLSDALLAISISLLAITSLTQMWWLYGVSLLPATFGVLMGLAGLLEWGLHPNALIKLLS
jgi:hypothetical protein